MGDTKFTFKRYEKKYLLTAEQYSQLWNVLEPMFTEDQFHHSTVCSLYYDNDSFDLIRASIEKPVYKEKLRLRCYNVPNRDSEAFVELKKKYKGVVYKRRERMTYAEAFDYLAGKAPAPAESQITREIDWFMHENHPVPKALIACERFAYVAKENSELRLTFDKNLRWRSDRLDLSLGSDGDPIIPAGDVLMEIKIPGAAPMWLSHALSDLGIFPQSFSKYGTCYKNHLLNSIFSME